MSKNTQRHIEIGDLKDDYLTSIQTIYAEQVLRGV